MQVKCDYEGFKGYQFGNFDVGMQGIDEYVKSLPQERQKYYHIIGDKLLISSVEEAEIFMTSNDIQKL